MKTPYSPFKNQHHYPKWCPKCGSADPNLCFNCEHPWHGKTAQSHMPTKLDILPHPESPPDLQCPDDPTTCKRTTCDECVQEVKRLRNVNWMHDSFCSYEQSKAMAVWLACKQALEKLEYGGVLGHAAAVTILTEILSSNVDKMINSSTQEACATEIAKERDDQT